MKSDNTLIAQERESTESNGLGIDNSRARDGKTVRIDEIQRPGVSMDTLQRARIRQVEATEAQNLTGTAEAGILIPYLGISGRPIYDQDTPFYVLRLQKTKNNQKYSQKPNSTTHIYIPPDLNIEEAKTLVIVEGEFKVLSLWERGIAAVGIKGFHGFVSPGRKGDLHPELVALLKQSQKLETIEFLGDTDTTTNKNFAIAVVALLEGLINEGFDFDVKIPRLPFNGPKGIDDCFEQWGEQSLEKWSKLERISLDRQDYKGRRGVSTFCFDLFSSLDNETLEKIISDGGKSERRLFELISAMGETPSSPFNKCQF